MCMFTGPVEVLGTQIFARLLEGGRQVVVYQMEYQAKQPTAMILPLPVALPVRGEALEFIDMKRYPEFFLELGRAFPPKRTLFEPVTKSLQEVACAPARLVVHTVGDFVASFVPTLADFKRLDPRFVMPESAWAQLPQYHDYGFAVFQLAQLTGKPHPMAFTFPTRLTKHVFFPTVHVHDGAVHAREHFEHTLYAQGVGWAGEGSAGALGSYLGNPLAASLVEREVGARKLVLSGELPNQDTILTADSTLLAWLGGGAAMAGALALGAARKLTRTRHG